MKDYRFFQVGPPTTSTYKVGGWNMQRFPNFSNLQTFFVPWGRPSETWREQEAVWGGAATARRVTVRGPELWLWASTGPAPRNPGEASVHASKESDHTR